MMSFGFEYEDKDESEYDEQQQEYAFPSAGVLLVSERRDSESVHQETE